MYNIAVLYLWFITYSFIGWTYESIEVSIKTHKLTNRGMLRGPYCPIYGFGALIIIGVLSNVKNNPVSLFLSSMILTCTLEYLTSWILEKLFHTTWWDYSYMRFNINGRVCLAGALVFALLGTLLMYYIHPSVKEFYFSLNYQTIYIAAICAFIIFNIDLAFTLVDLINLRATIIKLEAIYKEFEAKAHEEAKDIRERLETDAEELKDDINEKYYEFLTTKYEIKGNFSHLLNSYPTIYSRLHPIGLVSLRTKLSSLKEHIIK